MIEAFLSNSCIDAHKEFYNIPEKIFKFESFARHVWLGRVRQYVHLQLGSLKQAHNKLMAAAQHTQC